MAFRTHHVWNDDQRRGAAWASACAVVIDIDFYDDKGEHTAPPSERRSVVESAALALGATALHQTPRGGRAVWLLHVRCEDRAAWGAASQHLCDQLDSVLQGTGFKSDRAASEDVARIFWAPHATVDGVARDGDVHVIGMAVDLEVLLPSTRDGGDLREAVEDYRRAHPLDAPRSGGTCPTCKHNGCFGLMAGDPLRWYCFSDAHERDSGGVGVRGARGWHGDILDLHAAAAGCSRADLLRQSGFLGGRSKGSGAAEPVDGGVPLGRRDPASGRIVLSEKRTLPTAEAFVREFYGHHDGPGIYCVGDSLYAWRDNRYVVLERGAVSKHLHKWLHRALRYVSPRRGQPELVPFNANPTTVNQALSTIESFTHLPLATPTPSWLADSIDPAPAHELLPCLTCNVHIPNGRVLAATPALFTYNALDFDYDAHAAVPVRWMQFLDELFGSDIESIALLQEWFGYALIADTSQQKMLIVIGPRRSGKGTVARVLTRLVGSANVVAPTVAGLGGPFGLQSLLGKTLAIVSDARFTGEHIGVVVERLLCISGEDLITVDRKFKESISLKLPTRFIFLSNELPRFNDASTALAGRFVVLRLTRSFFGKENLTLTDELLAELPGILLWAIDGWRRVRAQGRFTEPPSTRDAIEELADLSSPVHAFVREHCVVGAGHRVAVSDIYRAWRRWCTAADMAPGTTQIFGRDLAAAVPGIHRRRGTNQVPFYDGIRLQERP